jgi:aspartyl aminopeptidase
MMTVNQTAKTLDQGIKNLMAGAKADYVRCSTSNGTKELTGWSLEQTNNWDKKTKILQGKKYIKVVQDTGVFAFIVKEDFKHFKKGDILKAAGWNAPALNSPRGNVLTGNYPIEWTGPLYLK